jgi:branched-chain amino acid transport system ATP-binding protein
MAKEPVKKTAKKAAAKKAAAKKAVAKKPVAKKVTAKSAAVKKAPVKKAAVKKAVAKGKKANVSGYGSGGVDVVMSVDQVAREAASIAAKAPGAKALDKLSKGDTYLTINDLRAGYGKMEILHNFNLRVGRGQSLCLIGPNGAGKSTVLHSIFGFTNIFSGSIVIDGKDVTALTPSQKLAEAGIAYILQDKSVFPQMTVEENLLMGGFLKDRPAEAKAAAEMVFDKYSRLADRRDKPAGVLSGGERRLLEISRALVMQPQVLLVDEPSIGLEPRFIDMVFEILDDLQRKDGKTIVMVEQNAKKGLAFADIGYVLVSGETAIADSGDKLLKNPDVGRLFLGG